MRCAVFFKKWLLRRHALALQLIYEAAPKLEQQDGHENREFIILVLDPDVQMLPWENNPVITKQEVYRMPSAGSQYMPSPEIEKLDNPVKPQYKSPVY
ncbi:hypothetical protein F2Q68_00006368 [Brassica cretica]|uniref:Uncharacterized protein n=1 Tax=Brassica cretica TaxID=69181 RepID=A0A8S9J468_BRACR|nr:hypothetical protein F2Q68_00006368 [Brassica cretica]